MNTTVNNTGEVRPTITPVLHDRTATYTSITEPEARSKRIAAEAARWLQFATDRTTTKPAVLTAKALDSACFSVVTGAAGFAVPSKLVGVREHQRRLWQIVRDGYCPWDRLDTDTLTTDGVRVLYGDVLLGEVQSKHLGWMRPLIPFGLTVHLARITGSETEGRTLGVNVVFGHVGTAITALNSALGASGDGAATRPPVFPVPALPRSTGDGASGKLSLVVPAGHADPLDVVLYRDIDGTAHATVAHTPVHSPTGIDWGRLGAGPTDLALAVLTAVAGADVAERYSADFAAEVVARLPYAGGVLRAADVRRWLARQTA